MRNVSRETLARLEAFAALVLQWTPKINLVSKASTADLWQRHIVDSVQIFDHAPTQKGLWADLGSGGGFPGMVIACLAAEERPELKVTLVESDLRKAEFLRHAARQLHLDLTVNTERIEQLAPLKADVISARALAPLDLLCAYAARHLAPGGIALFPKGAQAEAEIKAAEQNWHFRLTRLQSETDESAVLLKVEQLAHV
jgi:16S rRNA (guanine527-N7)-methyltransferase